MKWSDIDSPRPAPRPDQVEDRILDYFSRRLSGEFVIVTRDSRVGELGLDGADADGFLRFLRDEFGFEAPGGDGRSFLTRAGSVARIAEQVGSAPPRPRAQATAPARESPPRPPQPPRPPRDEITILEVSDRTPPPPIVQARPVEPSSASLSPRRQPEPADAPRPRKSKSVVVDSVACTQIRGDPPTDDERLAGPLYESAGKTREGFKQYIRRTDGMRCVLLDKAVVTLGSDACREREQRPAHKAKIGKFLIDAEPVCSAAFARFLNAVGKIPDAVLADWIGHGGGGSGFALSRSWGGGWSAEPGAELEPITLITWFGANAYSLWANRWDWRYYPGDGTTPAPLHTRQVGGLAPSDHQLCSALPSEAQWEYAARGADFKEFPWGDDPANSDLVSLFKGRHGRSAERGAAPPLVNIRVGVSPFGVHHMAGSLRQWCRDWYSSEFYASPAASKDDPLGRENTGLRSERGGAGDGYDTVFSCSHRRGRTPQSRSATLGFRCIGAADEV